MRALALGLLMLASGGAVAASPEEVKQKIEKAYAVQVLKITPAELDGRKIYQVRVMRENNGSSGAFGVTTLAVDTQSGELVSVFRHGASRYALPDTLEPEPDQVLVPSQGSTWR